MNEQRFKELYQETFSRARSHTLLDWEDMASRRPRRRGRALLVLAAAVAAVAALTAGALAADLFGLRTLLVARREIPMTVDPETGERPVETVDFITLSGSLDTPEGRAAAQWDAFLAGYDVEGAADAADRDPSLVPAGYGDYSVFNREMAAVLEDILDRYSLKLRGDNFFLGDCPEALALIDAAMGDGLAVYPMYGYTCGTFQLEGDWPAAGTLVGFQLRRSVRGYFDDIILNIMDAADYREWTCDVGGQTVILALGRDKSLLLADLEDCLVTVNVLGGAELGLTEADLEGLARQIDFSALSPAAPLAPAEPAPSPEPPALEEDPFYLATGMTEAEAQAFFSQLMLDLEAGDREAVAVKIAWPRTLTLEGETIVVETAEDFLPYYDALFTPELLDLLRTHQYHQEWADLFYQDGAVGIADGALWFGWTEDGRVGVLSVRSPEGAQNELSPLPEDR